MLTSLYIHIPFCDKICTYCDFHKEIATLSKKNNYLNALLKELQNNQDKYTDLTTVYIGGGTPSSLSLEQLELLFSEIHKFIKVKNLIEFSIEGNPNDFTLEKCQLLQRFGITRVSLGVQTFNEDHLSFLGRTHNKKDVLVAIDNLKEVGINNINVDMIFSLINQTKQELLEDIDTLLTLDIVHISYYSLILEEKTKLYHLYNKDLISINSEDLEGLMYNIVLDKLQDNGFNHYEISNFCKDNLISHHNKAYWTNIDYLGLGSGAHSLHNEHRFYNVASVKHYIDAINNNTEYQTRYERNKLEEELMMGLRLLEGIDIIHVNQKYNIDLLNKYPKLQDYIQGNLLEIKNQRLSFTRSGLLLGNLIFELFLEG